MTAPVDKKFTRHISIVDPSQLAQLRILLVGLGSFGSWTLLNLIKMGCQDILAYDFDDVSIENYANQIYWQAHVGKKKADVMASFTKAHDVPVKFIKEPFKGGIIKTDICISAVDNMKARKALWETAKLSLSVKLFLDARMAGTGVQCFALLPKEPADVRWFEDKDAEWLFDDNDKGISPLKCTEKGIVFGAQMGALHLANAVAAFTNKTMDAYPRFMEYDLGWKTNPVISRRR
jgi:molybdopterin/thiamine biosynthesis adenylyltransferase